MSSLYPVSSARISDQLLRGRLTSQLNNHRAALLDLQSQLSTGQRLFRPSDDSTAAIRAIGLQRSLEQKDQIKSNLSISQSFVTATESSLSTISSRITELRGKIVDVVDSGVSDDRRALLVQDLDATIRDLVTIANREFRGRHLFAGSNTAELPFEIRDGNVIYHGNDTALSSYIDTDYLSANNATGNAVFGALSAAIGGAADLNPVPLVTTRLSSLNGGLGVTKGSFLVSDGSDTKTVDISGAETLGDVIRLIESNPPSGRTLVARVGGSGLTLDLDDGGGGSLIVLEAAGGTTAAELGIQNSVGVGVSQLAGADLSPQLELTAQLPDLLGRRGAAYLESTEPDANIVVESATNGAELNGVAIRFVEISAVGNAAFAVFDLSAGELVIDISEGATTAETVVAAIDATGVFTAKLDTSLNPNNDGSGTVELAATDSIAGGSGLQLDQASGIQVQNGGETHVITFENAETVEDLLNLLNTSPASLLAEINAAGTGIDVRSRLSGTDFQIGENGGTTATELGIRSFDASSTLGSLNYGRGVDTADGTDFVIRRKDGIELAVDVSAATTVADVISLINDHADNVGNSVTARLATVGNGIELLDSNQTGTETLSVRRVNSFAAWGLGLVDEGAKSQAATAATPAVLSLDFAPLVTPNSALSLTANQLGSALNGVEVVFANTRTGDVADVTYDSSNKLLTVNTDASQTTATTIVNAINLEATFSAALDSTSDLINDGSGIVAATGSVGFAIGGAEERLIGRDVRPTETHGVFNSLIRLRAAVADFDLEDIGRATEMLDVDARRITFARAELGSRGQLFDAVQRRLEDEEIELRSALSKEIDTDFVQAASDLTARQASFEATLQLIGRVLQLTVLDFI